MMIVFLSKAADVLGIEFMGAASKPSNKLPVMGPTAWLAKDVPFSLLEANVNTQVAANQADDTEVDLSIWALPDGTIEQSEAPEVLRRFATDWWAYNLSKKAWKW